MKKAVLLLIAVGLLLVGIAVVRSGLFRQAEKASAGSVPGGNRPAAADFQLTDLNGRPIQLSALRGKVVLLDFWATWCPPCRAEIPHFRELYTQYKEKGLEIVGVSLDEGGVSVVRDFMEEFQVNYPVAMSDFGLTRAYGGIRGIPTTFLIDKQGRIAQKYVGYREKSVFEDEIRSLLAE